MGIDFCCIAARGQTFSTASLGVNSGIHNSFNNVLSTNAETRQSTDIADEMEYLDEDFSCKFDKHTEYSLKTASTPDKRV